MPTLASNLSSKKRRVIIRNAALVKIRSPARDRVIFQCSRHMNMTSQFMSTLLSRDRWCTVPAQRMETTAVLRANLGDDSQERKFNLHNRLGTVILQSALEPVLRDRLAQFLATTSSQQKCQLGQTTRLIVCQVECQTTLKRG